MGRGSPHERDDAVGFAADPHSRDGIVPSDLADSVTASTGGHEALRTVLMVSYTFPPQFDVSAKRVVKLCKYLPNEGWRPIVLTKDWRAGRAPEDRLGYPVASDESALEEVPGVLVERTAYRTRDNRLRRLHKRLGGVYADNAGRDEGTLRTLALARRLLTLASPVFGDFPDRFRGWADDAVDAGVRLVERHGIDAVCSFCPPPTAHVVAAGIARRCRIPWVAQFDDLFSFLIESHDRASWRWYARRTQRRWLRHATLAGAITPASLDYVRRVYDLDGDVVMVGFDPDEAPVADPPRGDRLRIVYTGSVYPDDQRPELFFEALESTLRGLPEDRRRIEVTFAGARNGSDLHARSRAFSLASEACVFVERVAPQVALRMQREAHGLLLLNYTRLAAAHGTVSFPAKAFEYLGARRPILALPRDPGGWGDELLRSTGAGVAAATPAEAAGVLRGWLDAWGTTGRVPYTGDERVIARYTSSRQAAALGSLLDRAVAIAGSRA